MATKRTPDEYEILRAMILRGDVMPSERLIETDFAKRIGTNRANIRHALVRLEEDGLVTSEPHRGTHVRRLTAKEAVDIFEVRASVESMLLPQAMANLGDEHKLGLRKLLERVRQAVAEEDPLAIGRASRAVREELWRISGHGTAQGLLRKLNSQLVRINFQAILLPGRAAEIALHVERLVEAVCSGSLEEARALLDAYHRSANHTLARAIHDRSSGILPEEASLDTGW